jgi:hypothetical protein
MYSSKRDEKDLLNNKQSLIDYVNTVVRSGGSGQDFVFQLPLCDRVFDACCLLLKKTWVIACVDKTFLR